MNYFSVFFLFSFFSRLVYQVTENYIVIISCKYHY
ncbi:MAG: type II toxin-antitoxin system YoeB family toxin [Bacteroidetes bacterium]|nr:type II toxin-antitoxin system YoeB family toxin [Bacteroidota bacterium]